MPRLKASVLVVEDEKLQSWSVAEQLSKWGFRVQPAFTGRDALARMQESGFDIMLLDYQLPDVDGIEVARQVKRLRPQTSIILITAFQESELPAHAGLIDEYFNKPLDMPLLQQALQRRLKQFKAV